MRERYSSFPIDLFNANFTNYFIWLSAIVPPNFHFLKIFMVNIWKCPSKWLPLRYPICQVGEPSGPTWLFLWKIKSFQFKSFCSVDGTNDMVCIDTFFCVWYHPFIALGYFFRREHCWVIKVDTYCIYWDAIMEEWYFFSYFVANSKNGVTFATTKSTECVG